MVILGAEYLKTLAAEPSWSAKMVFNARGAIIFPTSAEHRDQKAAGISYEDDYRGNSLAAMLSPGRIEVRRHRDFAPERVAILVRSLLDLPELNLLQSAAIMYAGQPV